MIQGNYFLSDFNERKTVNSWLDWPGIKTDPILLAIFTLIGVFEVGEV